MRRIRSTFFILLILVPITSEGETFTAVCHNPQGSSIAYEAQKESFEVDNDSLPFFNYSWDISTQSGTIVSQNGKLAGNTPLSYKANVTQVSKDMLVFFVLFEHAIEVHSLYLDQKILFYSSHKSLGGKVAIGKTLYAKCKIGIS